ncbi:amidohydrolase family protein [Maribacter sp. ACAM166]|uniref:amidohydrolase family protein n=1 Tax=Maribacter sp. ACAM166 TaxID=2508996 RepID=UPI0010FD321D|nr:amidohydrolase family protein [Maribacter sp. ACAM166]TLP80344.1 amidohydrolase [Maribacter sp. ACAM166]
MKKTIFILSLIIALVLTSCTTENKPKYKLSDQAILVHNGTIINVKNGDVLKDKAILIDSGMIKSIGNYDALKSGVNVKHQFDATGKFIIPGLWDMHVHIEGEDLVEDNLALLPVFIAYGVTTVRDMASDLGEQVLAWRDDIEQDKILGPQLFTAGRKLEGINSIWKRDLEIANEEELAQMLDKLEYYNVDLVKITENTLPGPLFLKSVQEAKKRGFMVSGHIPIDLTIQEVVDEGFTSIEHASYLLRLGSDEQSIVEKLKSGEITKAQANELYTANFNQDIANRAYQKLGKTGIAITPTLIGGKQLAYLDEDNHENDAFSNYLTNRFTANYQWRIGRMANDTPEDKQARKDRYELIAKQLPYIQKAGIKILAGSDAAALNTYVYPAQSLHEELVLFQEAGLTPLQILQSATINGAELMGTLSTMATIEPEKQADLVILSSNPLLDIKATQDIYAVINDGEYFDRAELDAMLQIAKNRKIQLDKERD